jgi:pilus assembly protein CpaC
VRAKAGITIACFSALTFVLCAVSGLQAQTPPTTTQPATQPTAAPTQDSANELSVAVGKTVLVDTARPITRVAIGMAEIAQADAVSPNEIMVNGKTPGETSLIIWDNRGGRQFFNVTVRASMSVSNDNLDAIRRELRTELPGTALKVSTENGIIFLRGTVKDLNSSERAIKIASTGGKVVNLLNVTVPPAEPQILLKVRFASVDLNREQQLGINFFSSGFGNTLAGITTGQFSPPSLSTLPVSGAPAVESLSSDLNIFAFLPGLNLGATLEALETKGVVQILSEPNVMAMNGKEASFLAGGQFPYPVVQGASGGLAGAVTIQFQDFGVRLNFIGTVTPRGTIRLQVAPEVSTLDFTQGIQLSGFDVPAIDTRKMKTEVELSDGQSFGIGGLLDDRDNEIFQKIPFLGDIPILGKFFQSMEKTKTKTELIVTVTPEIVSPIEAGSSLPQLKFPDTFLPPNSGIPMNTPDAKTAANTLPVPPATIPVETLVESMKPEKPLIIESATGNFGAASTAAAAASSAPSSAPSQ